MSLEMLSPPAVLAVELSDIQDFTTDADEEGILPRLLKTSIDMIERRLDIALIRRTLRFTFSHLRNGVAYLPSRPLISVASVEVLTSEEADFIVLPEEFWQVRSGKLYIDEDKCPYAVERDGWRVTYTCGYGNTPDECPPSLTQAVRLLTIMMYTGRPLQDAFTETPLSLLMVPFISLKI